MRILSKKIVGVGRKQANMQSIGNFNYHNQVKHDTNRIANESSPQRQLYNTFKLNTCGVIFSFLFFIDCANDGISTTDRVNIISILVGGFVQSSCIPYKHIPVLLRVDIQISTHCSVYACPKVSCQRR
jgi:hypothetical protein